MIDVKGTRDGQSSIDPSDPMGLHKPEPGNGKVYSGWFAGLIALGLYIRSFLWPEEETGSMPQDAAPVGGGDEDTEATVLREASLKIVVEDPDAGPVGSSQGTGAAEPPQPGPLAFPVVLGPFHTLFDGAPLLFSIDVMLPRDSANTPLPPYARLDARGPNYWPGSTPPSPGRPATGEGTVSVPRPDTDDAPDDSAEKDRNRAPRNNGPVYLADVGSGAAVGFSLSFFLSQTIDPDGGEMNVMISTSTSGTITARGDGWRYLADTDFLGEVRIDYTISDGTFEVVQSAYLNVVENVHTGSDSDDLLVGTRGRDMIDGQAGNDNLAGLGGRDRIYGNDGDDNISGGDGNDSLFGGNGDDMIVGGAGDDWISGGAGRDRLYGGLGDDEIYGDDGDDVAYGGAGRDTISGGDGDDVIRGGTDGDILSGDAGADQIFGDEGDDLISGGDGDDMAFGGADDDVIFGDDGDDQLHGGDGDDILAGDTGDDILFGEDADDVLTGGAGEDFVSGGAGDDVVIADDDAVGDHFDGGEGHDRLDYSAATQAVIIDLANGLASGESTGRDSFENFEHFVGSARDDVFQAGAGAGMLTGNGGADLYSFVQGDTVDIIRSMYQITDYDWDDQIWIGMGSSRYHIRKAQKSIEDRIEDGLEDYAHGLGADEPRLSFHFDWTETYRRTAIEVDFDRDKVVDLELMIDGEHVFVVDHA